MCLNVSEFDEAFPQLCQMGTQRLQAVGKAARNEDMRGECLHATRGVVSRLRSSTSAGRSLHSIHVDRIRRRDGLSTKGFRAAELSAANRARLRHVPYRVPTTDAVRTAL